MYYPSARSEQCPCLGVHFIFWLGEAVVAPCNRCGREYPKS